LDSGVGVEIGPVAVKLSGSVNGFYVHDNGDSPAANRKVNKSSPLLGFLRPELTR
jgi:hypothetical protein